MHDLEEKPSLLVHDNSDDSNYFMVDIRPCQQQSNIKSRFSDVLILILNIFLFVPNICDESWTSELIKHDTGDLDQA